jgi:soluble lytic murein transglycosylase-like protein
MKSGSDQARAEAHFKKEEQARQGQKAMTEYQAERQATLSKMAKLRAQRLAHEAKLTDADTASAPVPDEPARPAVRRTRRGIQAGVRGSAR